jgi:hypothetical protein
MALAELHGKTPYAYSEDLLTADVFAAFRYLPVQEGIYAFLRSVPGLDKKLPALTGENVTATFYFWPMGEQYRREPDMLLALQVGQRLIHVVVEAKYLSGASDLEIREVEKNEQTIQVGNQLADQFRDLQYGCYKVFQGTLRSGLLVLTSDPDDRHLLYLTAHILRPKAELERAQTSVAIDNLFWANWYQVYEHFQTLRHQSIQPPYTLILQDICQLLTRKGFATFQGFRLPPYGPIEASPASFWRERHVKGPTFSGITPPPPELTRLSTTRIFWTGDKHG